MTRAAQIGAGPPVVLVHGVGVGPWSYAALARDLAADHEVIVAHRRGYGDRGDLPVAPTLAAQVDDLVALVPGPAAFVGVSGGATLVLALAIAHPGTVAIAVVHEPVIGPLAPELHGELRAAAECLATSDGEGGAVDFVRALVGPATWDALAPTEVADVARRAATVRAEVAHFLAFAPSPAELGQLRTVALVSSVGALSRRSRHAAAAAVAAHAACSSRVLPGGHLAQLDAPAALAGTLRHAEALALQ